MGTWASFLTITLSLGTVAGVAMIALRAIRQGTERALDLPTQRRLAFSHRLTIVSLVLLLLFIVAVLTGLNGASHFPY